MTEKQDETCQNCGHTYNQHEFTSSKKSKNCLYCSCRKFVPKTYTLREELRKRGQLFPEIEGQLDEIDEPKNQGKKPKGLKEVYKMFGILDKQFIEINHIKLGNTAIHIDLPLIAMRDTTITEVRKIIKILKERENECMERDEHEEQIVEHQNQIEMCDKILKELGIWKQIK